MASSERGWCGLAPRRLRIHSHRDAAPGAEARGARAVSLTSRTGADLGGELAAVAGEQLALGALHVLGARVEEENPVGAQLRRALAHLLDDARVADEEAVHLEHRDLGVVLGDLS